MNSRNYPGFCVLNKRSIQSVALELFLYTIFVQLFSPPDCKNSKVLTMDFNIRRSTVVSCILVFEEYFYCSMA